MKQIQLAPYGERNTKWKQRASCLCDLARHPLAISPLAKSSRQGVRELWKPKGRVGLRASLFPDGAGLIGQSWMD